MKSIFSLWIFLVVSAALSGCAVSPAMSPAGATDESTDVVVGAGPATTLCCHEFPEVLSRRVHPVLEQMPGVTRLERLPTTDGSLCYRFRYEGALEPLEARLERDLRTSSSLSFKIERGRDGRMIDLVFDGGFD